MNNIITQIWQGSLDPMKAFGNPEIHQLERFMASHLEKLEPLLSEEAQKKLKGYNDCVEEYDLAIVEQAFHDGFCLGAKITAEALVRADYVCPTP